MKTYLNGAVIAGAHVHEHGVSDSWDQRPKVGLYKGTYRLPAKPRQPVPLFLMVHNIYSIWQRKQREEKPPHIISASTSEELCAGQASCVMVSTGMD